MAKTITKTATARIGWRGISLAVPEEWALTSVSGEGPNGYLRVESPDTRFLQVKWWERKGIVSVPDALDAYIRDLRKKSGKRARGMELKTRPRSLAGVRPGAQAPVTYTWTAEQRAYGVVWHCGTCKRLVVAEVVGRLEDDFREAAPILSSIREHGENNWNLWGMFGLAVEVPTAFQIEKQQLMTGFLQLAFRDRARTLLVQRWGLANVALKGTHLREWYDYQERNRLSRYRYRFQEEEIHGHPGLRLIGHERLLPGMVKGAGQLSALTKPALYLEGVVWECPESNKICAITAQRGRHDDTLAEVVRRFCCHDEAGR
jgi:hypothetical protein